jgi:hypothetical protein
MRSYRLVSFVALCVGVAVLAGPLSGVAAQGKASGGVRRR